MRVLFVTAASLTEYIPHRGLYILEIPGKWTKQHLDKVKENVLRHREDTSTEKVERETFCEVRTESPILPGYGEDSMVSFMGITQQKKYLNGMS